MNTHCYQILRFSYRSENLRHLSEQNSKFWPMITKKNALTDFYNYFIGTKFMETVVTVAVRQTVVTLYRTVLFKAMEHSSKMP